MEGATRIHVEALTRDEPFFAGVVVFRRGRLVLALNDDHLPSELADGKTYRVSLIGGGPEARESVWECALREAHEEIGVPVDLVPSPVTHLFDWEERTLREVECTDELPAPVLLERSERPEPDVASKPGLPSGPYLYVATFLAVAGPAAEPRPGDVAGLVLLPLDLWPLVADGATVAELVAAGAEIVTDDGVPSDARVWLHPNESGRLVVDLLADARVRAAVDL